MQEILMKVIETPHLENTEKIWHICMTNTENAVQMFAINLKKKNMKIC